MNIRKRLGRNRPIWLDHRTLKVNGNRFFVIESLKDLLAFKSSVERLLLGKTRPMVEDYIRIGEGMTVRHMFELGIFKGGSTAFFHALYQPGKLVAIDFKPERAPDLDAYIRKTRCAGSLVPLYSVNQADRERMEGIVRQEFPEGELDMVVDDASHFLPETTSSFNVLFPRVRPGGIYIIEDWSWAHAPYDMWQKADTPWSDKPSLSHLIFEIVLSCASMPDLIDDITVNRNMAVIRRGSLRVSPETFDISKSYLTRGKKFEPVL